MSIPKNRNSQLYLLINIFQNLWFIEVVWYFFLGNFVTYYEIGIVFAISTIVGILAEIPTGYFADRFGRKLSTVIGSGIMTVGWLLLATVTGFWQLLVGSVLGSLGRAFVSGALEAITFDSIRGKNKDKAFQSLLTLDQSITTIILPISIFIGGYLYTLNLRLPHLLFALVNFIAFIFSLLLAETASDKDKYSNSDNVIVGNLAGFRELFSSKLSPYLLPMVSTTAAFLLYDWGFSKPTIALNAGFGVKEQTVVFSILSAVNLIGINLFSKFRSKNHDTKGLIWLNMMVGVGFLMGSFQIGSWGIFALLFIELASYINKPWVSLVLNQHIAPRYRATSLSTLEFIAKFPYLLINIILGSFIDAGRENIIHLIVGIFMLSLLILWLLSQRKDNR